MNTQENIQEVESILRSSFLGSDVKCSNHDPSDPFGYVFRIKKNNIITIIRFNGDIIETYSINKIREIFDKHYLISMIRDNFGGKIKVSLTKVTIDSENL